MEFEGESQLKDIGNRCFQESRLSEIRLPQSVRKLGTDVFAKCKYLKTVVLNDKIRTLPDNTFLNSALEHIAFPSTMSVLGRAAFQGCKDLKTIWLPECLNEI